MKTINFKGNPVTLVGRRLRTGTVAPDFKVVSQDLKEVSLSDFTGKIKVITSFPSLDTSVCDLQVKEFNKRAAGISSEAVILGISKDLPFAQKRFCDAFDIGNVRVLSDYRYSSFGINYGLLIKELNLLARGVLILDKGNVIRYMQVSEELTTPLDYDEALKNLSETADQPEAAAEAGAPSRCVPCEGKVPPLPKEEIERSIARSAGWELVEGKRIVKKFEFADFAEAKYFLDLVSIIAEEQGHHPTMTITYNKLKVTLTTHAADGLTGNDFIMAAIIDELGP